MTSEIRQFEGSGVRDRDSRDAAHRGAELVGLAVTRLKEGDTSALHFLYLRCGEEVHRYVQSIVRDYPEAEDVTQGVFLELMSVIEDYEPRAVPFEAWLLRVARNAALDSLRVRRAVPSGDIGVKDEGRDQLAFERRELVKAALELLPREQREVLVLRYVTGLPPREVACVLHRTESSIHDLQHRGRRALKAVVEEVDASPLTAP